MASRLAGVLLIFIIAFSRIKHIRHNNLILHLLLRYFSLHSLLGLFGVPDMCSFTLHRRKIMLIIRNSSLLLKRSILMVLRGIGRELYISSNILYLI